MPSLEDITIPLEPGHGYHIFNRGNEGRLIFFQDKNYKYFLDKYKAYMNSYWDTYAYCLLPNHFHLAIKVKDQDDIFRVGKDHFSTVSKGFIKEHWPNNITIEHIDLDYKMLTKQTYMSQFLVTADLNKFLYQLAIWTVSERFRRFLLGYAKAINVQEKRHGSLFQKLFRRKLVASGFSKSLIAYIHRNPIHHNYCKDLDSYPWSSYSPLLNSELPLLAQKEVMKYFDSKARFVEYHQNFVADWRSTRSLFIEE